MNRLLSTRHQPGSPRHATRHATGSPAGRRVRAFAVCLFTALVGACGRQPEPPDVRVVERLIPSEPVGTFEDGVAGPRVDLVAWNLRAPHDRQRWEIVAGGSWDERQGMPLKASLVRLRAREPIDAAGAESLRLDLGPPRRCRVAVHWRGASEPIVVAAPPSPAEALRVELSASPEWTGSAKSLTVTLRSCRGGHLLGVALERRAEQLGEAFTSAWKVTIGDDTRRALLAAPGTERRWQLAERLTSGRLQLALGATDSIAAPIHFTIGTRKPGAGAPGGGESVLSEVTLEPQVGADRRWRDLRVPLADLDAGSEIYLRADSEATWKPGDAVPAFAEPRILAGAGDRRPNILLLSIDTLRADRLSLYGYGRETSPHLDRRARSTGITFSTVVASASWTLPSHVSMLSGLDALRHGVNHETTAIPGTLRFVAESLRDAGYATVAFTAGGYVSPEFGFSRGFESFRARRPQRRSVEASREELRQGVDRLTSWLAKPRDQPFFAFFHTYEVHAPFWAREPYFERFGGRPEEVPRGYAFMTEDRRLDRRTFVIPGQDGEPLPDPDPQIIGRLYDSGIAYMDGEIERLLAGLEAARLADDTIVVLTSDHGESLGEHDLIGHGQAYDEVIMIPLVLWVPGVEHARVVESQVRLVDVAPTLLDLAGVEPARELDGQSLRPLWENATGYESKPAWTHSGRFGVAMRIADRVKYIWHRVPWDYFGAGEELFDLRDDPTESRDLSQVDADLLSSARDEARAWLLENLPGPRLTVENGSDHAYELRVTSSQSRAPGITDFGCRNLDWQSPGTVILRLDPGESCKIVLEHLRASDLLLEAWDRRAGASRDPAGLTLDPREAGGGTDRVFIDGVWESADDGRSDGLTVRVEWPRGPIDDTHAEVRIDEALAEQLRALGYLD